MISIIKSHFLISVILLSCGIAVSYNYTTNYGNTLINTGEVLFNKQFELHNSIIHATALSPYNFRILVPFTAEFFIRIVQSLGTITNTTSFHYVYATFNLLMINLFLFTSFYFFRLWHNSVLSLIGVLFCFVLLPLALRDHYFQPWSLLELNLYLFASIFAYKRKIVPVICLSVIACLNRETGVFVPLLFLITNLNTTSKIKTLLKSNAKLLLITILVSLLSVGILFAIRQYQGSKPHVISISGVLKENLLTIQYALIHIMFFGGIFWYFAVKGWGLADRFTKRLTIFFAVYLIPILIFGIWRELRMIMPVYPVLISLGLFHLKKTDILKV